MENFQDLVKMAQDAKEAYELLQDEVKVKGLTRMRIGHVIPVRDVLSSSRFIFGDMCHTFIQTHETIYYECRSDIDYSRVLDQLDSIFGDDEVVYEIPRIVTEERFSFDNDVHAVNHGYVIFYCQYIEWYLYNGKSEMDQAKKILKEEKIDWVEQRQMADLIANCIADHVLHCVYSLKLKG